MEASDDIPGKLKVDSGVTYDPACVLHVGLKTVMADRLDANFVDTETLFVRGIDNARL